MMIIQLIQMLAIWTSFIYLSFICVLNIWSVHRRPLVVPCPHSHCPSACLLHWACLLDSPSIESTSEERTLGLFRRRAHSDLLDIAAFLQDPPSGVSCWWWSSVWAAMNLILQLLKCLSRFLFSDNDWLCLFCMGQFDFSPFNLIKPERRRVR